MSQTGHKKFMRMAIEKAAEGVREGQTPFGACIVKNGDVVALAHNEVLRSTDITAHAEVVALRQACRYLKTIDLTGCVLYSTCEPCPMCFSAAHWARIGHIYYGAGIEDARTAGFNELSISNQKMKNAGKSPVGITSACLAHEARELFECWKGQPGREAY